MGQTDGLGSQLSNSVFSDASVQNSERSQNVLVTSQTYCLVVFVVFFVFFLNCVQAWLKEGGWKETNLWVK